MSIQDVTIKILVANVVNSLVSSLRLLLIELPLKEGDSMPRLMLISIGNLQNILIIIGGSRWPHTPPRRQSKT